MTETNPIPPVRGDNSGWLEPGPSNVQLVYILYLVSFVVGVTALVGIVVAYINRGKRGGWVETHYTWAIRTFWIGVLAGFVSAILMIVGIGFLLMIALAIWVVVRCIVGLQAVGRSEPIKNPQSWTI